MFPEFPDYDDSFAIPDGWMDVSYKDNACPNITRNYGEDHALNIYCDYKDASRRRDGEGSVYRFIVTVEDGITDEYRGCFCQFEDALLFANALLEGQK
jgi:hypothetical protein